MSGAKSKGNGAGIAHAAVPNMNADYTHKMFVLARFDQVVSAPGYVGLHNLSQGEFGDAADTALGFAPFDDPDKTRVQLEARDNTGTADGGETKFSVDSMIDAQWYYLAFTRRGRDFEVWQAPADGITAPTLQTSANLNAIDFAARVAADGFNVGVFRAVGDYTGLNYFSVTGRAFWTKALDAEGHRKESLQKHPVDLDHIWASWLTKHKSDVIDYTGNGRPWKWAQDVAEVAVDPTTSPDVDTEPDNSIDAVVPDGELGIDPEDSDPVPDTVLHSVWQEIAMRAYRFLQAARDAFDVISTVTGGIQLWHKGGPVANASGAVVLVDAGVVTLNSVGPNFVERSAAGTVSANTSAFTAGSTPLYHVTMVNGEIDTIRDMRLA